jgi:hypothetical protein
VIEEQVLLERVPLGERETDGQHPLADLDQAGVPDAHGRRFERPGQIQDGQIDGLVGREA